MIFDDYMKEAAIAYGVEVTAEQIAAYRKYYELLVAWNEKINLTAITEPDQVAVKHMIDSISCYDKKIFFPNCTVIDVGTGAGFPGLPLKIWQRDIELTLMDSLNKRIKFLQTVVDTLGLDKVSAVHSRAEEGARLLTYREQYDVAVSRAVARLNVLAEYCLPFVKVGGYFVALKGAQYQVEAEEAVKAVKVLGGSIEKIVPIQLPGLEDKRAVVYIKKVKQTPKTYPRKAGTPEKSPL